MTSTHPSRATPAPEREAQLLAIGKQCSEATCHLIDFLPFKCQHCKESFCQEHFKVEAHRCPEYDETKHDRVAPNCPMCNTPVAIPPGQDPNVQMDTHLTRECPVMTGKEKTKASPVCAKANCKKVLPSPIQCTQCQEQFCPFHRYPADHNCATSSATTPGSRTSKTAGSGLLNELSGHKLNNAASAASSAMKKTVASASASVSKSIVNVRASAPAISNSRSTSSSSKSPGKNPFSKVDSNVSLSLPTTDSPPANTKRDDQLTITKPITTILRKSYAPPPLFACT